MAKDKSIFEKMYPEIKLDTTLDDRPQLRAGRPFETKREFFIQAADRRPAYVREAAADPTSPSARFYNLGKDSLENAAMMATFGGVPGMAKVSKLPVATKNARAYREALTIEREANAAAHNAKRAYYEAGSPFGTYAKMGYDDTSRISRMEDAASVFYDSEKAAKGARAVASEIRAPRDAYRATIWPTVGRKTTQAYRAIRNMDFAPAGRFLRSAASNASVPFKAAAEAVLVPASKVIPMSKRIIPTVIEDVITPWARAHKAMAASGAILSAGTVGGTIYTRMANRSGQDAVTSQVSQARSDVSNNWAKIEKDIDLSDAAAVKARVSNVRDALEYDVQKFGGNDAEVRRAIGEAESRIAPLRGSKGWKDAIVNATTEYMAGAADPANYESEYKSIYKDEESQILGSDFGRLFRKGAK